MLGERLFFSFWYFFLNYSNPRNAQTPEYSSVESPRQRLADASGMVSGTDRAGGILGTSVLAGIIFAVSFPAQ